MYPLYILPCLLPSGFTSDFRFYDYYYIIVTYILLYRLYSIPPVSCPYLLHHEYSLLDITCYISTCSYMLVLTSRFLMHVYDSIYRYTCVYLCTPFGISITTRWEVLTPLNPHVQVSEFGASEFSRMLISDV